MPLRILFILLAFLIFTNLVIMLVSLVMNTNLYKTHGKLILNCYGIFALIIIVIYFLLPTIGD